MPEQPKTTKQQLREEQFLAISLKTLAQKLDAHRSSVRRWLQQAGIHPIGIGKGRNGAIRYRWPDIQKWLDSLDYVD